MVKAIFRDAEYGDGYALAPNLREADKNEMKAATGQVGPSSLEAGIKDSEHCWVMEVGDEPAALYGYRESESNSAYIWLMGSDVIQDVRWQFLRESKNVIKRLLKTYDSLWSLADVRNTKHQEWYEWLGFKVNGQVKAGPYGNEFNLIELKRDNDV